MIPINEDKFTKLQTNEKILYFEVQNNSILKGFVADIDKDDNIVLLKLNSKNTKDKQEFDKYYNKLINENKVVIIIEDI
jgi:hypothetical protein